MSKPEEASIPPISGFNQFSAPLGAPPPSQNPIPIQFQWNMVPNPNGTNVFSAPSPWNVSPQHYPPILTNQWNIQPAMMGQNLPNNILPQLTGAISCHQTFVKGKPKALGITLIVTAICQILFAISLPFLAFTITFISGIQFWAPVFYIIGGSLTIKAQKIQSIRLVKSSYGLNIVSSIFSFIGIILNIVDYSVIDCEDYHDCHDDGAGAYTIVSILLILNLLVFCVAVSIAVFGGRALDHVPSNVPQVFVVQNVVSGPSTAPPMNSSETSIPPPPYAPEMKMVPNL